MHKAHINAENQRFVIEDSQGNLIAKRPMPTQWLPNPGKARLLLIPANLKAWEQVLDLVLDANIAKGLR